MTTCLPSAPFAARNTVSILSRWRKAHSSICTVRRFIARNAQKSVEKINNQMSIRLMGVAMSNKYTKQWIYELLLKSMPSVVTEDRFTRRYLRQIAKTARKAYLIGVSERRAGKTAASFRPMSADSSELEQSAWRFVFECYMAGTRRKE